MRQEVGQRNDDDRFPEQREEDGLALFVERLEGRLSAVLQSLSDEGEEVEVQRRDGIGQNGLVIREDADEPLWLPEDEEPDGQRVREVGDGHEADRLSHIAGPFCPVVVTHDRARALRHRERRHVDELPHAGEDGHDGDVEVAAETGQHRVAGQGDERVGDGHDEPGRAE